MSADAGVEADSLPPIALGKHGGVTIQKEDTTVAFVSDRRLYLTADKSAVVEEGDPAAAFLLVAEGGEVPTAVARRYGLQAPGGAKPADEPAPAAVEPGDASPKIAPDDAAKAQKPADNKAVAPKADK